MYILIFKHILETLFLEKWKNVKILIQVLISVCLDLFTF